METKNFEIARINSPVGCLELCADNSGLKYVQFLNKNTEISESIPDVLKESVKQLNEYFSGERIIFDLKMDPQGTPFQQKVWKKLIEIPYGKTISYQKVANALGDPKVIRAAASANGKNPIAILIPCHRVIGSDGSLTGYAGGLHRKKWLLEHENPSIQLSLF